MKSTLAWMVIALAAQPAWLRLGHSGPWPLRPAPNLAKDAEALPTLVGGTRAIAKINRALAAANARQLVTVPLETLKTLGVNAALLRDIETSHPDLRANSAKAGAAMNDNNRPQAARIERQLIFTP